MSVRLPRMQVEPLNVTAYCNRHDGVEHRSYSTAYKICSKRTAQMTIADARDSTARAEFSAILGKPRGDCHYFKLTENAHSAEVAPKHPVGLRETSPFAKRSLNLGRPRQV